MMNSMKATPAALKPWNPTAHVPPEREEALEWMRAEGPALEALLAGNPPLAARWRP